MGEALLVSKGTYRFFSKGAQAIMDTQNEAVPRWGKRRLITSVYLLKFVALSNHIALEFRLVRFQRSADVH